MSAPEFQGMWIDGTFIPPGLMEFSHYHDGCPVFVPRLIELTPDTTAFADMLAKVEPKHPVVDWLAE